MRLAADAGAALAALDAAAVAAPQGDRAVIADDGARIVLVSYGAAQRQPLAAVEVSPLGAVRLAADLTAAAARHLARGAS